MAVVPSTPQEALAELQQVYYTYLRGELATSVTIGFGINRKTMNYKEIDESLLKAEIKALQEELGITPAGTIKGLRTSKFDFVYGGR